MKQRLKLFTGAAAVGMAFAASSVGAEETHDDTWTVPDSTLYASVECIEDALTNTLGEGAGIDSGLMEHGLITAENWIDNKPVFAEVYLGVQDAVASINITVIEDTAASKQTEEGLVFETPQQGTATIFYRGNEGVPAFASQGADMKSLDKYIKQLDQGIRSCPTMAMS